MQRKIFWLISLVPVLFLTSAGNAQWEDALATLLSEVKNCSAPVGADNPCNTIAARAAMAVYGIEDFAAGTGGAMGMEQMIAVLKDSGGWANIGAASGQDALNAAQQAANEGKAVLAVLEEEPVGHVAIILPGKLGASGKWAAQVPNSASFFLNTPGRSYVGKTLAYAFKEKAMVTLYVKK